MGLVFLVQLAAAGYRQRDEARTLVSELQNAVGQASNKSGAVNAVSGFLVDGRELSRERLDNEEQYQAWKQRLASWLENMLATVKQNFTEADHSLVVDFGGKVSINYGNRFNEEHNSALVDLNQILENLRELIERHSGASSS